MVQKRLNAEEIVAKFGHLSLAEVYTALAYYHANTQEIEDDLAAQAAEAQRLDAQYAAVQS